MVPSCNTRQLSPTPVAWQSHNASNIKRCVVLDSPFFRVPFALENPPSSQRCCWIIYKMFHRFRPHRNFIPFERNVCTGQWPIIIVHESCLSLEDQGSTGITDRTVVCIVALTALSVLEKLQIHSLAVRISLQTMNRLQRNKTRML